MIPSVAPSQVQIIPLPSLVILNDGKLRIISWIVGNQLV